MLVLLHKATLASLDDDTRCGREKTPDHPGYHEHIDATLVTGPTHHDTYQIKSKLRRIRAYQYRRISCVDHFRAAEIRASQII